MITTRKLHTAISPCLEVHIHISSAVQPFLHKAFPSEYIWLSYLFRFLHSGKVPQSFMTWYFWRVPANYFDDIPQCGFACFLKMSTRLCISGRNATEVRLGSRCTMIMRACGADPSCHWCVIFDHLVKVGEWLPDFPTVRVPFVISK